MSTNDRHVGTFDEAFYQAVELILPNQSSFWKKIAFVKTVEYDNEDIGAKKIYCFEIIFHVDSYITKKDGVKETSNLVCLQIHPIGHTKGDVLEGHVHLREVWGGHSVEANRTFGSIDHFFYDIDFSEEKLVVNVEALQTALDEVRSIESQFGNVSLPLDEWFQQYFNAITKYNQILRLLAAAAPNHRFQLKQ